MTTRGDRAPWIVAQPTATNDRLCSMLSALLLRRPAPPLENRLPWQLFDPKTQARERNIFLLVLLNVDGESWPDHGFFQALQRAIQPALFWFCGGLFVGGNSESDKTQFRRRWSRFMSGINCDVTDIYVLTGSMSTLNQLSDLLTDIPNSNIRGIFSVLDSASSSTDSYIPHVPDDTFHWIIHTNDPASTARKGALAAAYQGLSLSLTLSSWPPTTWLVRAVIWFAYAVQVIMLSEEALPQSRGRARL